MALFKIKKTEPTIDHAERPKVQTDTRVYAVGDIHGRHDLLMEMLENILSDAEQIESDRSCEIILLGDYIDRGDNSRAVLETLVQLSEGGDKGFQMLKGNHEAAMLDFIDTPLKGAAWLEYGAQQTLASYGVALPKQTPNEGDLIRLRDQLAEAMGPHLDFVRKLSAYYISGDVIFTHAGFDPCDLDAFSNEIPMLWGHPSSFDDCPINGKLLVHGHYDALEPVDKAGRICVDTGAYYTGCLTAVRLDETAKFLTVHA